MADAITRLANDSGTERINIESLSATDVAKIVEIRLGGPLDRNSVEQLLRTSEGNPLLLSELLDASQQAGTLTLRHGVWTLRELTAASSVREMFRERVARWPRVVAEVIATVAVAESVRRSWPDNSALNFSIRPLGAISSSETAQHISMVAPLPGAAASLASLVRSGA